MPWHMENFTDDELDQLSRYLKRLQDEMKKANRG